jgi:hypothetical protein
MSFVAALNRIAELHSVLGGTSPAPAAAPPSTSTFAATLQQADTGVRTFASTAVAPTAPGGTSAGQAILAAVRNEVGQAEQPPGSNDSPRIAEYRTATAGSGVGPWCGYFVSWAAQQAGAPLGEAGQGFGAVSAVSSWAQRTGRWNPAASGTPPQAGDLIVWGGQHIGIVESVDPDGKIHTVEGNSSNMVTRRTHDASGDGATGYVRLG